MHNLETVRENEMNKILRDFVIQAGHLISARRTDLVIINQKQNLPNSGLCCQVDLDIARELKKTVEYKSDGDTSCDWYIWYSHQMTAKVTGRLGNKSTSWDHPNYSIVTIGPNIEDSGGDLSLKLQWEAIS